MRPTWMVERTGSFLSKKKISMERILKSKTYGERIILFDEQDLELFESHSWTIHKSSKNVFYARTKLYCPETQKSIGMYFHRAVMGHPKGMEVDHIDHNTFNNFRSNLRIVTRKQNNANLSIAKRNTTGFKGVHFFKRDKNYQSYITANGKRIHCGYFKTAIEAAIKYNEMAVKHHGEFASLNKIPNG